MYRINDFASILGITPKALRLYEKKGIFLPAYVDEKTGYRYYDSKQVKSLTMILQLKYLGFSLSEIKSYQDKEFTIQSKIETLLKKKRLLDDLLTELNTFSYTSEYSAYFRDEDAMTFAYIDTVAPHFTDLINIYPSFTSSILRGKAVFETPDYLSIEFLDGCFKTDNVAARLMLRVKSIGKYAYRLDLPKRKYLATLHVGPYETIYKAYDFLDDYVKTHGLTVCGNPSERYFDNYYTSDDENKYVTEVRFPIL